MLYTQQYSDIVNEVSITMVATATPVSTEESSNPTEESIEPIEESSNMGQESSNSNSQTTPDTGDYNRLSLWAAITAGALIGLVAVILIVKKRREQ